MLGRGTTGTTVGIITAVIADDEILARNELAFLLKDFAEIEIVGLATNGLEAVEMIENLEPDLVFLDVQMPGLDGLGVIQQLRERDIPLPHFVLATAFDQYAIEAFRLEALDYLLKPIEKERLEETVNRARRIVLERQKSAPQESSGPRPLSLQRSKILVKSSGRSFIVDAQDIVYATI